MSMFQGEGAKDPLDLLQSERPRHRNVEAYIGSLFRYYRSSPWMRYIMQATDIIEPIDRTLGQDDEKPSARAFFRGSLLGLHVTQQCASPEVRAKMLEIEIGKTNDDEGDELHMFHGVAESIIGKGEQGCDLAPDELVDLVESWEDEITPYVRYQPYVRYGFGVMVYLMHEATEQVEIDKLWQADRDGVDWDAELSKLLPPPETA